MGILFRKLLRDIKEARGQFISILVIVVIGVMFYSGINSTFRNLSVASEKYYKEYRFADLWVDFYRAPENAVERVNSLPYVKTTTGRLVMDASMTVSDENATLRFITLPEVKEDIVNDIVIKSGRYFGKEETNQCLVEEEFYKAHNMKLGDYIYPVISGNEVKMKVIGAVKSPEFIYTLKDGGELMPDNSRFGIVFIKKSFGQEIFGFHGSINSACILLESGVDLEKAKDDIERDLKSLGVMGVIDRENQISNKMLSEEMRGLQSMAGAFPVVFFIVAAVIIYIMMSRMVENQRTQIGVLKALGFSNMQVLYHYLSYSVFIAITGSAIGSIFGMYLGAAFTNLENMYFHLPLADMRMYPDLILPASALTLIFCLLAGYNSCKKVFKILPSEAMLPKAPPIGKKIFMERVKLIWDNTTHAWRMILRNVFRHKRRALLTSTGIIFCVALLLVAFSMKDSIDFMVEQQYKNIQDYDIKVSFSRLLNLEEILEIRNISHVAKVEPVLETGVEIQNGWRKKTIGFTALIKNPEMYRVVDKSGQALSLPKDGILIPEKLSTSLDIKPNDTVFLKPYFPGKEKREVTVKGIAAQYIGLSAYTSMENVNHIFGEGLMGNSAVIKLQDSTFEKDVKDELKNMASVASVQSKSDALNALMKNMGAMSSSIGVMILLAAILSIAVVYNTATINIFERQRELATLKVLGFKDNEIKKLIFNENYMITVFAILVGLPFGNWLGITMMLSFTTDFYSFPFIAESRTYVLSAVLTLLFTMLANFILMKKIKSISIVEVLKNRE